ncbi:fibronectin-like [Myxocyprinus asiaticus]|uniref:fibronectin-like n=1 Tax=Myxocyprinus asiaticus TaxID=70543 RepID=UPI0022226F5C|nr:fibronectin-like [Myxocyprinus asiaticus]
MGVSSISTFLEPGEPSNVTYTTSSIPKVSSISVEYSCIIAMAWVSWKAVFGATSYTVVAADDSGMSLTCTSTDTTCQISSLSCGERYNVRITAIADCQSTSDTSYTFETAPCPPKDPRVYLECSSNVILFSWASTNNTAYYIAMAVDSDVETRECVTVDTSCYFINTGCGKRYSFTVSSVFSGGQNCDSGQTDSVVIRTAPCLPQNIHTAVDCSIGTALTSWDAAEGALTYTVEAHGNQRDFYNCSSHNTSCTLTGLDCGDSLSVWIAASDDTCMTDHVLGEVVDTVPCSPQDVSAVETCSSNSATLSWLTSNGAVFYIGVATHSNGSVYTCTAMATECEFQGLRCGETYDAYVIATSLACNSTESEHVTLQTAPCAPVGVGVTRDCAMNFATVSWQTLLAGGLYTVVLEDEHGAALNCSTSLNTCTVPNLHCGVIYNVTVTRHDGHCRSLRSTAIQIQPVPCDPQNVTTLLQCDTNVATVTWNASAGASGYTAIANTDGRQQNLASCHSTGTSCQLTSLPCGMRLNVTVLAEGATCNSSSETSAAVLTAPCIPTHVTASLNCTSKIASITWYSALGATGYFAKAEGNHGHKTSCDSTNTHCDISDLQCGQDYSITVAGVNGGCKGPASQSVTLVSAPCIPVLNDVALNCSSRSAVVMWSSSGLSPDVFSVSAVNIQGGQLDCGPLNGHSCVVDGLQCGHMYTFSVNATQGLCTSSANNTLQRQTAPCPPQNILSRINCGNNTVSVSWSRGNGTLSFTSTLDCSNGQTYICKTTETRCDITNLPCGQTCTVRVVAEGQSCNSSIGTGSNVTTGPCVPQNVSPNLSCSSNIATVSWGNSQGAELYSVTAISVNGLSANCTSSSTSCDLSTLTCGETYTITVKAKGSNCNSENSALVQVQSAPCPPQNIQYRINCGNNTASVSWSRGNGTLSFTSTLDCSNGQTYICKTTETGCDITNLPCGQSCMVRVVAEGQSCNSSIGTGTNVTTEQCVPGHVQGSVDCASGNVSISWDQSVGAVSYMAVAQGNGGYASVCHSTETPCVFSDLLCGLNYSIAVSASGETCSTAPSQPVVLSAVSCKPQNVSAQLSCDTNAAIVTWEPSDNVVHHTVQAVGTDGHRINCTSSGYSCTLLSLHCGQNYNLIVTALDGICDNSNTHLVLQSAPCAPSSVQTFLLCDIHNGSVVFLSWQHANEVESYMAVGVSNDGHSSSCNTSTTYCALQGLQCGQIYNVSVLSLGYGCGSVKSAVSQVQTAPCPPQNVDIQMQCELGSVVVSWSQAEDASQFRVELESHSTGVISSCNSNSTQCSITHLPCGESFNLSVVALRGNCQSQPSSGLNISSAPCAPQGVNGTLDCVTNSAWVSWDVDKGAESYTVLAIGDDGQNSNCSTTNSTCNVPDLGCGKSYTFHVTASIAACLSPPSNTFNLETAPCALSSIVVVAECRSHVILVQWQRAQIGNSLYIATAEGQDRSLLSCNSATSSCKLTDVQCGMEYTIIVAASSNQCSGLRSPPYKISTAPCQPMAVEVHTDCQSKAALVSWEPSYVAQSYLLTAVGKDGNVITCNTSNSTCMLTDLRCSNTYNLSVSASNENCTSLPSPNVTFHTLPCTPNNLTLRVHCGNSSASLSWAASTGAVAYVGIAQSGNATTVYCQSTNTSCTLQGLVCGTVYNFTVQASDGICNSSFSEPLTDGADLCPPGGLRAIPHTVVNDTQIMRASWSAVDCPDSEYLLELRGRILDITQALFDVASYWTSRTFFEIPLPCGSSYSATVRAQNSASSSVPSAAVSGTTVPCAPQNVTFSASLSVVTWNQSVFATNYTVYLVTSSSRTKLCMTPQLHCSLTNISSGHIVATASNSAGESEDSSPVLVTAGRRR